MQKMTTIYGKTRDVTQLFLALLAYSVLFTGLLYVVLPKLAISGGIHTVIAAILAFLPIVLYLVKTGQAGRLMEKRASIGIGSFFYLLSLYIAMNLLVSLSVPLMENVFQTVGLSARSTDSGESTFSIASLVYTCLLGPVMEEVIYRGAVLSVLKKRGTKSAILLSALLFGVMHHDFYQGLSAFGGGVILGYAASRYSLGAAIVLHIANNSFAEALPYLKEAGSMGAAAIFLLIVGAFLIAVIGSIGKTVRFARSRGKMAAHREGEDHGQETVSPIWGNPVFWIALLFDSVCLIAFSFHSV